MSEVQCIPKIKYHGNHSNMYSQDKLTYWTVDCRKLKGSVAVESMRACERMDRETFNRSHMFQLVYLSKSNKTRVLYMQGNCYPDTKHWVEEIRKRMDFVVGNDQWDHYHRGAFLKRVWSCCRKDDKYAQGCCGITESNESRTRRLSREVSFNVTLPSPGRSNSGSSGTSRHSSDDSWRSMHRHSTYEGIFSDDEYSDEDD